MSLPGNITMAKSTKTLLAHALSHLAIDDLDGDGVTEVAYSVRDPAQDFRSLVRVHDAETGEVKFELPDYWGAAVVQPERQRCRFVAISL